MNFEYMIENMDPDALLACGAITMMQRMRDAGIPIRIVIAPGPVPVAAWFRLFDEYLNIERCDELQGNGCLILLYASARVLH